MRLHDYILEHMESILTEWENFARSIQPEEGDMDVQELRDHAEEMLRIIAADMQRPETEKQSTRKSRGKQRESSRGTAAQSHAVERLESGFSISLLTAEFRALRASVLRLWSHDREQQHGDLEDVVRFNEAIDQALAESLGRYSEDIRIRQDVFVGALGHDLRTPLQSISSGAQVLIHSPNNDPRFVQLGYSMNRSSKRMAGMINNLLDFTQARIGGGMSIEAEEVELTELVEEVVEEFRSYNPDREIRHTSKGNCVGQFDAGRVARIYQNLISNALQHGAKDKPVVVETVGEGDEVIIRVYNHGPPIPKPEQDKIFDLLYRHSRASGKHGSNMNMGLGLYIVKEIVSAHGGQIELSSSEDYGTEFVARLPRNRKTAGDEGDSGK